MQVVTASSSGLHNVFVYGSLLADEVVTVLLQRVPRSRPAILHDFHRFSIKGRVYPAILPVDKKSVTGKVLMDVTTPELDILDTFEDVEYERRSVLVNILDNSDRVEAQTYVWRNANDPDLYGEWDFEDWKKKHMDDFVKMTIGFVEELEQPESKPRVETYESFFPQDRSDPTSS
ncbi:hypothetical protein MLD38_002158 [Melastoma candidum]|uniref:Uncharacterized protein n=1 Tax=Melastoma candidum TaxID=119954 RepID=A0ACB9SFN2_9MYRT|nr:hypothetical protein MLD38_002158 [Melastoma candidum]